MLNKKYRLRHLKDKMIIKCIKKIKKQQRNQLQRVQGELAVVLRASLLHLNSKHLKHYISCNS